MGHIVALVGPTGVGKTSIARALLEQIPQLQLVRSLTTRDRYERDLEGEYSYIDREILIVLHEKGLLISSFWQNNVHYGTSKNVIQRFLDKDSVIGIMMIDERVAEDLYRFATPLITLIYVYPPSDPDVHAARLVEQGHPRAFVRQIILSNERSTAHAKESRLPYMFVKNDGELSTTVEQVRVLIRKLLRAKAS